MSISTPRKISQAMSERPEASDVQVDAAHAKKMFLKLHSTNYKSRSSLPSIPVRKQQMPRDRMSENSGNSFMLRFVLAKRKLEKEIARGHSVDLKVSKSKEFGDGGDKHNERQFSYGVVKTAPSHTSSGQIFENIKKAHGLSSESVMGPVKQNSGWTLQNASRSILPQDHSNHDSNTATDELSTTVGKNQVYSQPHDYENSDAIPFASPNDTNFEFFSYPKRNKKLLQLPPLLLPPIHNVIPRPLKHRDFLTPTKIRGPIGDEEWEELLQCRYIRHATPRYALKWTPSKPYISNQ